METIEVFDVGSVRDVEIRWRHEKEDLAVIPVAWIWYELSLGVNVYSSTRAREVRDEQPIDGHRVAKISTSLVSCRRPSIAGWMSVERSTSGDT